MVQRRKFFRSWRPSQDKKKEDDVGRNLSEDESFTGWWTEGSAPFRRSRTGTVKRIDYLSQTGDKTFMGWWCEEIRRHGYDCELREKERGDFELSGNLASARLFHTQVIEPRKMKLPLHKRKVHIEAMTVLRRQTGRGFGEKIRSQFK
jgi:hypothetical protein